MPLDTTLADITARLRKNGFPNKQAISQGIVLRVLSELGWDIYEPAVVWPEYQTRGGRADFALCHPPSKPAIFIEVKHVGGAEGAVQQALRYASHCSVPFVVLTDGRTWSFYLPTEQSDYDDRRVCRLDLQQRSAGEAAETFRRYLTQRNVTSGKALEAARTEYRNRKRRSKAAIPEAWRELVHKRDGRLLEILADAVESQIGFPPDAGDVVEFLGGAVAAKVARESSQSVTIPSIPSPRLRPAQAKDTEPMPEELAERRSAAAKARAASRRTTARNSLVIRGEQYHCSTAKDAMVTVLRTLADSDPSFLERFAQHPAVAGRKRRYIGRTVDELYPSDPGGAAGSGGRKSRRPQYEELPGGWLVATQLGNGKKREIIDQAVETAGCPRKDIVLPF